MQKSAVIYCARSTRKLRKTVLPSLELWNYAAIIYLKLASNAQFYLFLLFLSDTYIPSSGQMMLHNRNSPSHT